MPNYPHLEFALWIGTWSTEDIAYPDTGFEGGLTVPLGVVREVLAEPDTTLLRMADGAVRQVRAWRGVLELDGRQFEVEVVALGNRYLIGREVLDQLEICFKYGRKVELSFTNSRDRD